MARRQLNLGSEDLISNFEFALVGGEQASFLGYISASDPTTLSPRAMVRGSKNMYKKLSGTLANRPGLKLRGVADTAIAGVVAAFEWQTSWGQTRVLRVANGKLQFESDMVASGTYQWYDLLSSLTLTRFIFDSWWNNSLKRDVLLMANGSVNTYKWDGGIALFVSAINNTSITLDRDALTNGFATTGTVTINGVDYAYTGISGAVLTGVTGDASAQAVNSVVYSKITTTANLPASTFTLDFLKVINNQVHYGSYTSRLVYVSQNTDYTNVTVPASRVAGDPDIFTGDSCCSGITVQKGDALKGGAVIAGSEGDWYQIIRSNITVGAVLQEQVDVTKTQSADLESPFGHEFIDVVGDTIIFLDKTHQLHQLGFVRSVFAPTYPQLSTDIQTELSEKDPTGGHLRAIGDKIYITMPLSGDVYIYRISQKLDALGNLLAERLWFAPFVWNVSRVAVINGVEYGHSNANPQLYQLWDTNQWHDDSPSGDPLAYESRARFAYQSNGRREGKWAFDKVYIEAYATQNTTLLGNVYFEYQGSSGIDALDITSPLNPATQFSGFLASSASLGQSSLGGNPLGQDVDVSLNDQDTVPKIRAICGVQESFVYEYGLEVYSANADDRWELLFLGANAQVSYDQASELMR
jgi:hypothetical protein